MHSDQLDAHRYDDIIHLPHHVSTKHPRMPLPDRAAQFSPFAALTGHEAAIRETERLTEEWAWLDEDRKAVLDGRLMLLREHLAERPEVTFLYFQPDGKKSGGAYLTITGRVKKIDDFGHQLVLEDGTSLDMERLFSMEGELFGRMRMP